MQICYEHGLHCVSSSCVRTPILSRERMTRAAQIVSRMWEADSGLRIGGAAPKPSLEERVPPDLPSRFPGTRRTKRPARARKRWPSLPRRATSHEMSKPCEGRLPSTAVALQDVRSPQSGRRQFASGRFRIAHAQAGCLGPPCPLCAVRSSRRLGADALQDSRSSQFAASGDRRPPGFAEFAHVWSDRVIADAPVRGDASGPGKWGLAGFAMRGV